MRDAPETQAYVMAQHQQKAQAWAESCALSYRAVHSMADWPSATKAPGIIEAFTDAAADADTLRQILSTQ